MSKEMMQPFQVYTEEGLVKHKKNTVISALTSGC